ncbi:hypothetical protein [Pseudoduganella lutea]|uniref:Uncharacterized protein n=1 Tax=Pseudoduganella lutea TaxID=321985 RepID=A0A4P6L0G6_9BURK|nr:hypothetical protein [Pseudoduganella lutea]QBE64910.1 hypothetical protein EWM63_19500 [Pseudoduganella lutea]
MSEQLSERVMQKVAAPLQRTLIELPGVTEINSTTSHGYVNIEIQFEGGATENDVATVSRRIEELVLDGEVVVTSKTVHLAPPRL